MSSSTVEGADGSTTGCDVFVAWYADFQSHIDSMSVTFLDQVDIGRVQCGSLIFGDQQGKVIAQWWPHVSHEGDTTRWQLKHRSIFPSSPDSMAIKMERVVPVNAWAVETLPVRLSSNADAVSLRMYMGLAPATTPDTFEVSCEEACAQHWREVPSPSLDSLSTAGANTPVLYWTNGNWERSIDTTEIYRNDVLIGRTGGTTHSFTDDSLPNGFYSYRLRHFAPSSPHGLWGYPNSSFSNEDTVRFGPPPPAGLTCEGNFAPTMDCHWYNAVADAQSQVFREPDTMPRATFAGGGINTLVT